MFRIYESIRDGGRNRSRAGANGIASILVSIAVGKRGKKWEAYLGINDTYCGGGTLTRELPDEIFNHDFSTFIEKLCYETSVSWFMANPEKVKKLRGIRRYFGFPSEEEEANFKYGMKVDAYYGRAFGKLKRLYPWATRELMDQRRTYAIEKEKGKYKFVEYFRKNPEKSSRSCPPEKSEPRREVLDEGCQTTKGFIDYLVRINEDAIAKAKDALPAGKRLRPAKGSSPKKKTAK